MSGEVVVVGGVSAGTAGAVILASGGLVVAGGLVYQMIREHQRQRQMRAIHEASRQKRELKAWQDYQLFQQQSMQRLNEERQMTRDAFANLSLNLQENNRQQSDGSPETGAQAQSFLDSDETLQVEQRLTQLQDWLEQLPEQIAEHQDSPIPRLKTQLQRFFEHPPLLDTVENFIETARRSVTQFSHNLEEQERQQAQILELAGQQLDELLNYRQYAEKGIEAEEASALQTHLLSILEEKNTRVSLNALELLQKKSAELKRRIDERLERQAAEEVIQQRIRHHLSEMGYSEAAQYQGRVNSWTIPGGEQVRFALQPDFKMSFQVAHERTRQTDTPMSLQETAFLHQQERKWCKDLPKLIKKLQADGLNYQVDFERQLPDDGIPIVVLETVDDLLAAEEEDASRSRLQQSEKRYLDR